MALIKTLSERYPYATAAFLKWLEPRGALRHYTKYLRRPFEELPTELIYGVVMEFLEHSGVMATSRATSHGRWRLQLHIRRITGRYDLVQPAKRPMDQERRQEYEIATGFHLVDQRLRKALQPPSTEESNVLIGLDVEAILEKARKDDAAVLR